MTELDILLLDILLKERRKSFIKTIIGFVLYVVIAGLMSYILFKGSLGILDRILFFEIPSGCVVLLLITLWLGKHMELMFKKGIMK